MRHQYAYATFANGLSVSLLACLVLACEPGNDTEGVRGVTTKTNSGEDRAEKRSGKSERRPKKNDRDAVPQEAPTTPAPVEAVTIESPQLALVSSDPLAHLPKGEAQRKILCQTPSQDRVREVFCSATPPVIRSLTELQQALGLSLDNRRGSRVGFVFTAASSSLVAQQTSSINPRLILFTRDEVQSLVTLGFVRGEQFAEIAARDPVSGQINFFLVEFTQACNQAPGGCTPGELLTPAVESNWTEVSIYQESDVENTILDCLQCHQPGGVGTPKMLRMQELRNPWMHFMRDNTAGGQQLLADFRTAKGNETYAGIPANRAADSDPAQLENLVRAAGFGNQPNEFNSTAIGGRGGTGTAAVSSAPEAWAPLYEGFVQGRFIAPPFHRLRPSDPEKLASMTAAYQAYTAGTLAAEDLPDIRKIHAEGDLRDLGFQVKAGLSGEQILIQACHQCHHPALNANITRAKFSTDLSRLDCKERQVAIDRLRLAEHDVKIMPPQRFRKLDADEIERLIEILRCDQP